MKPDGLRDLCMASMQAITKMITTRTTTMTPTTRTCYCQLLSVLARLSLLVVLLVCHLLRLVLASTCSLHVFDCVLVLGVLLSLLFMLGSSPSRYESADDGWNNNHHRMLPGFCKAEDKVESDHYCRCRLLYCCLSLLVVFIM